MLVRKLSDERYNEKEATAIGCGTTAPTVIMMHRQSFFRRLKRAGGEGMTDKHPRRVRMNPGYGLGGKESASGRPERSGVDSVGDLSAMKYIQN